MNLEARIERLERVNRRCRTMAIVVGTLLVTAAMMGQAQPRKPQAVQAERFVVVDGEGKERAVLGMNEEAPTLWLNNRHGKPVLLVEVPKVVDQPGVFFLDADGKTRMELALTQLPQRWVKIFPAAVFWNFVST
jgi:hypothetical protein